MESVTTSAPGKIIVLGEHSVVYGKPAVALAIDKRFYCKLSKSDELLVNGYRVPLAQHPHLSSILESNKVPAISIYAHTDVPTSSGLGSSAALSSAFSLGLRELYGFEKSEKIIAKDAFDAEWFAQGSASPIDTSTTTCGGGVALNCPEEMGEKLWNISKMEKSWDVYKIPDPKMTFVIGYTGIKAATGPLVAKVRRYKEKNSFAKDIIDEIGLVTLLGMNAIRRKDKEDLGENMTKAHKLLSILGVSCNELNKLVDATLPYSYGSKLTGSGGGGSMISLTDEPQKVAEAIDAHGGTSIIVRTDPEGVKIEKGLTPLN